MRENTIETSLVLIIRVTSDRKRIRELFGPTRRLHTVCFLGVSEIFVVPFVENTIETLLVLT